MWVATLWCQVWQIGVKCGVMGDVECTCGGMGCGN